jgi:hypothetical protein
MIEPGSIADWALLAGMMGTLSGFAAGAHRWVLRETATLERARTQPFPVPATTKTRVAR